GSRGAEGHAAVAVAAAARAEAGACELAHRDRGRDVDGEGGGGHPAGGHDQREGADPATGAKGEAAAAAVGLLGHGEVGHGLVGEAQLPLDPAVLRVTLSLLLQPPLELKPALANSLTVTVAGTLTVKAVVVTPPVGMTSVKVPIPPPALKVKLPPPPLVCLDTVRLATAWLRS